MARKKLELDLMSVASLLDGSVVIQDDVEIRIEADELDGKEPDEVIREVEDCMDFNNAG